MAAPALQKPVKLQRVLSIRPMMAWDEKGKALFACETERQARERGAIYVRHNYLPTQPVFRLLPEGNVEAVRVHWVFELSADGDGRKRR